MDTIGDRINNLRLKIGKNQVSFADSIDVSKQTLYKYEHNIITNIPSDKIEAIAKLCNVTPAYIMGWEDPLSDRISLGKYRIPVVATVAAGEPIFSEESILEWIDYDKDPHGEVFGLRIKGDSMIPRISDGDTIVVDKSAAWEDGDIVVVTVNGNDGTCKRIRKYKDGISLISLNPSYEPMFFTKSQVEELPVRVVGRVMESRSKF